MKSFMVEASRSFSNQTFFHHSSFFLILVIFPFFLHSLLPIVLATNEANLMGNFIKLFFHRRWRFGQMCGNVRPSQTFLAYSNSREQGHSLAEWSNFQLLQVSIFTLHLRIWKTLYSSKLWPCSQILDWAENTWHGRTLRFIFPPSHWRWKKSFMKLSPKSQFPSQEKKLLLFHFQNLLS